MRNLSNGDVVIPVEGDASAETDGKRNGVLDANAKVPVLNKILPKLCQAVVSPKRTKCNTIIEVQRSK